jgi:hypothetical protein
MTWKRRGANLVKIAVLENELFDLAEQQACCEHEMISGPITETGYDSIYRVCVKCSLTKSTAEVRIWR